jgi:hypothetical protein
MTRFDAVRWGQPPLTFELRSSDDHVLARASLIFRPWGWQASAEPPRVWHIDPVPGGATATWRVTGGPRGDSLARESIPAAVRSLEFLAVQDFVEWPSACTLHGALVARSGRGVLLLGRGEAGKSTLACALWQRGWALLGDDMALVDALANLAWAVPRRVSLRESSRGLLGDGLWRHLLATPAGEETGEGCLFNPEEVDGRDRARVVRLAALVFLGRSGSGVPHRAGRLVPAHALLALLPYTNLVHRMGAGEVIRKLQPLAEAVPAWDLARRPLEEMIASVEGLVEARG